MGKYSNIAKLYEEYSKTHHLLRIIVDTDSPSPQALLEELGVKPIRIITSRVSIKLGRKNNIVIDAAFPTNKTESLLKLKGIPVYKINVAR